MNFFKVLLVMYCMHTSIIICSHFDDAVDLITKEAQKIQEKKERKKRHHWSRMRYSYNALPPHNLYKEKKRFTHILGEFCKDVFLINYGLFSWDTWKIIVTTFPFYVGSRMVDEKLHNCFFDHKHKKNKNEPAQWCKEVARLSIGVPIALLSIQTILSKDEEFQTTSQVFLTGMPFVLLAKDLIKTFDFDVCKRPWHEHFAKEQRTFGGFPSGHLAEATYMAVLYGLRYGPAFAVPLGAVAVFVACVFLSSNRHYLSQMIAGAGFGAMYAFSANTLIDSKLAKKHSVNFGLSTNDNGGPAVRVSLRF